MTYTIRLANQTDATAVQALLWAAKDGIGFTIDFSDENSLLAVKTWCAANDVWVATAESEVIGVMVLGDEEIRYLAVASHLRGKGICPMLIEQAKTLAGRLRAEVMPTNVPMVTALIKTGFQDSGFWIGERKSYRWEKEIPESDSEDEQ